jgi:hypothetical protein
MANKHLPKKGSPNFGTAVHYYFEIEPMASNKAFDFSQDNYQNFKVQS